MRRPAAIGSVAAALASRSTVMLRRLAPAVFLLAACAGGASKMASPGYAPPSTYPAPVTTAGSPGAYGGGGASDNIAVDTPYPSQTPDDRPGLGTSWGEQVWSPATMQPFVRSAVDPWATVALHYNDRDGVQAHASYLGATAVPLEVYAGDGSIGIS